MKCRDCEETKGLVKTLDGSLCFDHRTIRSAHMPAFKFDHLPQHLRVISEPFCLLAMQIDLRFRCRFDEWWLADVSKGFAYDPVSCVWPGSLSMPENIRAAWLQTEQALLDLMRAKDAAVRAALP